MPTTTSLDKVLDVLLSFVEDPYNYICDDCSVHHQISECYVTIKIIR